jgi:hypothetical protein
MAILGLLRSLLKRPPNPSRLIDQNYDQIARRGHVNRGQGGVHLVQNGQHP